MNAEKLEIARRLVACKGWAWLPGMVAVRLDGDEAVSSIRVDVMDDVVQMAIHGTSTGGHAVRFPVRGRTPDLSDDLTRLGVLAVVRRARNEPNGSLMPVVMKHGRAEAVAYYPMVEGARPFYAPAELLALLAALEAAP